MPGETGAESGKNPSDPEQRGRMSCFVAKKGLVPFGYPLPKRNFPHLRRTYL